MGGFISWVHSSLLSFYPSLFSFLLLLLYNASAIDHFVIDITMAQCDRTLVSDNLMTIILCV